MRIITGKARGLKLTVPKNYDVRPTTDRVKESLFGIIGGKIVGARVLDLFAGTGNLGLESWSRGAAKVTFVDISAESLRLVKSNIAKCRAEAETAVLKAASPAVLERLAAGGEQFEFIFCDPPYNKGHVQAVLAKLAVCNVLAPGGYLIVEYSQHDEPGQLPEGFSLFRQESYGETQVAFIRFGA